MESAENLSGNEAELDRDGLGIPDEMLDKIFSFVSTKSLLRARRVCRKWREISELSIKRRLRLVKSGDLKVARLRIREQTRNDLLQRVRGNMRRPDKGYFVIKNPGKTIKHNTAPLVTAVLKLDYISTVNSLGLENCISISCWDKIGLIILSKFKSITQLYITFIDEEKQNAMPLCFEELVQQQRDSEVSFNAITFLTLRSKQLGHEFRPAGFDVVKRCPNLRALNITCELGKNDHLVATGEFFAERKHNFRAARSIMEQSRCLFKPEREYKTAAFVNAAASCLHPQKVVTDVTLDRCLSVIDWNNGAGLAILKNFPHLKSAKVELGCFCENTGKIAFYSPPPGKGNKIMLTKLERLFFDFTVCPSSIPEDSTGTGISEPESVSYEILKSCPTLNTFTTEVSCGVKNFAPMPGRRTPRSIYCGYSLGAGRYSWDERGANSLGHGWTYTGLDFELDLKEEAVRNALPVIFESLLSIFRLIPPMHIVSTTPLDFLGRFMGKYPDHNPSACKSLTLRNLTLVSQLPEEEVIDKINQSVFANVKILTWTDEFGSPFWENFQFRNPAEYQQVLRKLMFKNLTTLSLWRKVPGNEAWQEMLRTIYSELPRMMPKMEIFVTPIMVFNTATKEGLSQTANHPYSLAQVLKLAREFRNLKHLVLVAKNWYGDDNGLDPEQLAPGLDGPRSVTVMIPSLSARAACSRLFVKLCKLAPSIKELMLFTNTAASNGQDEVGNRGEVPGNDGVESQDVTGKTLETNAEEQTPAIDYNGCTTIEGRLKVTSGLAHLLTGKAQFEGTKDSYITWTEIQTGPIDCLLIPDFLC